MGNGSCRIRQPGEGQLTTLAFLGDIALNGDAAQLALAPEIERVLKGADMVVGNLEGAVYAGSENPYKSPRVFMHAEAFDLLTRWNIGLVSLANNHVADGLADGFNEQVKQLQERHIRYLGAGTGDDDGREPCIWKCGDVTFGMLAYVDYATNPNVPDDAGIALNYYDYVRAVAEVGHLRKKVDHVVVQYHGGKDFSHYPSPGARKELKGLIDSGASLVVGHHPHVVQGWERHGDGHIFYSCGNFLFSDIESGGKRHCWSRDERRSLIVLTEWSRTEMRVTDMLKTCQKGDRVVPDRSFRRSYRSFAGSSRLTWKLNCFYVDVIRAGWLFFFRPGKRFAGQMNKLVRYALRKAGVPSGG